MRIWIDGQCLQTASRFRGIGRYALSLIKEIVKQNPDLELIISLSTAMPNEAITAQRLLCEFMNPSSIRFWQPTELDPEAVSGYDHRRQASEIALALHVEVINPDLILSMSPFEGAYDLASPFNPVYKNDKKVVQIFYDAIPERYPENYLTDAGYKDMYFRRKSFYEHCDLILSISDFTNDEASEMFDGVVSQAIYAGVDKSLYKKTKHLPEVEKKYDYLYVGALDFRKNVSGLVNAISVISNNFKKSKSLAVVGFYDQNGRQDILRLWRSSGLNKNDLHFLGKVNDDELLQSYKLARVVVQPSLMEGFGLTALEAILSNSCAAGSRGTALEEIIKDKRALFDPLDPIDMAQVLLSLSEDSTLRTEVLSVQKESLKEFTWEKSAKLAMHHIRLMDLPSAVFDLDETRLRTVTRLTNIKPSKNIPLLAEVLASNEITHSDRSPILAIDVTATSINNHGTGIQRVVCKTVEGINKSLDGTDFEFTLLSCQDWNGWYNIGNKITKTAKEHNSYISQKGDIILLLDSSWDHHTMHQEALWDARFKDVEIISCLYDIVPLKFIAFSGQAMGELFAKWFRSALSYSTGFICISKSVADELLEVLEAIEYPNELKIGYWHLGTDFNSNRLDQSQLEKKVSSEKLVSILMVGTIEPRKAHNIALTAFEKIWQDSEITVELVIVGKIGWASAEFLNRLESHPELGKRLIIKNKVSDEELLELYANCDALLACSYAEGFGLPIVEAGQMGKSVIASDIPVFREVAESAPATIFFKVGCPKSLKDAVMRFANGRFENSKKSVPKWQNWQESTDQLVEVITNDNWYIHYKPKHSRLPNDPDYIGQTFMTEVLDSSKFGHDIKFLEDSPTFDEDGTLVLTIIVINKSDVIFSSDISAYNNNHFPVKIAVRISSKSWKGVDSKTRYIELPFPIIQKHSVFYPLRVENEQLPKGGFELNVSLHQKGGADWGPGVSMFIDK